MIRYTVYDCTRLRREFLCNDVVNLRTILRMVEIFDAKNKLGLDSYITEVVEF